MAVTKPEPQTDDSMVAVRRLDNQIWAETATGKRGLVALATSAQNRSVIIHALTQTYGIPLKEWADE